MRTVEAVQAEQFEWDENKRLVTLEKSGLDFRTVAPSLLQPHLEAPSLRGSEQRIQAICDMDGRIVVVIYVVREDRCRIISAWPADKNEQRQYRQILGR